MGLLCLSLQEDIRRRLIGATVTQSLPGIGHEVADQSKADKLATHATGSCDPCQLYKHLSASSVEDDSGCRERKRFTPGW
mmetsp:Transcript_142448/g.265492  ORF Transcript_142448/g.265492 Transcript_142448/m.265492 type:complete len:80 (+) Transcript_142448:3050-3289(+)